MVHGTRRGTARQESPRRRDAGTRIRAKAGRAEAHAVLGRFAYRLRTSNRGGTIRNSLLASPRNSYGCPESLSTLFGTPSESFAGSGVTQGWPMIRRWGILSLP